MMEGPPLEKKDSAEQRFLIEKSDPEMRAAKFMLDPQEYINQYHDYLQIEHPEESLHAVKAVNEIFELKQVISDSDYTDLHPEIETFISGVDTFDPDSIKALLTWLKEAGFTKEQVRVWVDMEHDYILTSAEELQERSIGALLNQVFPDAD